MPTRRLLAVLAHPDDESLGLGGTLARYAAEGVETALITATRGERGWPGDPSTYPGPLALGRLREGELRAAAEILGLRDVALLDVVDGELSCVDPAPIVTRIVAELRRFRPDVVVTFGPDGVYGHPDHIAVSQLTATAFALAADPTIRDPDIGEPHRPARLYYRVWTAAEQAAYEAVFGDITIDIAGETRRWLSWPDWAITSRLDTSAHWSVVRDAVFCHQSQIGGCRALTDLPSAGHRDLWGAQHFYRAIGAPSAGPGIEDDLFAGLA